MSRPRTVLEVHLKRPGMGPASADAREVGSILLALADAVRGALSGAAVPVETDEPLLSLVRIEKGKSLDLAFATRYPEAVKGAVEAIVGAYQTPTETHHPSWARVSGKRLVETTKALRCRMEVRATGRAQELKVAVLRESTVFAEPPKARGTTVLWGEVVRVGGKKDATVAIDTGAPDGVVACRATREVARELAHRLYERVAVEGAETRAFPGLQLEDFSIDRVLPWREGSIESSLQELADVIGNAWRDVENVGATIHEIRSGEDE